MIKCMNLHFDHNSKINLKVMHVFIVNISQMIIYTLLLFALSMVTRQISHDNVIYTQKRCACEDLLTLFRDK